MRRPISVSALAIVLALPTFSIRAQESEHKSALTECAGALCARRENVRTVVARLRVTLHDLARNKDFALNGAYLGDAAGNLRLRVTTESGQLMLDLGMCGESVEFCLPGKELFISGTREELLERPRCHLTLLAHCGRARDLFFPSVPNPESARRSACRVNGRAYFNIPETESVLPRYVKRFAVDKASNCVEQACVFTRAGVDAGRVAYSNYVLPNAGAESDPKLPEYPRRVTLFVPGGVYALDLDVEDFSVNAAIAPGKFAVPVPSGFKRETLATALEKSANVWDQ